MRTAQIQRHVAATVLAEGHFPGTGPAQAEDALMITAGDGGIERTVDGQRQGAGRWPRRVRGGPERAHWNRGVSLFDQETEKMLHVADGGRAFAEAAEVGRSLGESRVIGIGGRAERRTEVGENDIPGCRRDGAGLKGGLLARQVERLARFDLVHGHGDLIVIEDVIRQQVKLLAGRSRRAAGCPPDRWAPRRATGWIACNCSGRPPC